MDSKDRLYWVDIAKCLGIFLMILGHGPLFACNPSLRQFIYCFHMPLFFCISGFLYAKISFKDTLKRDYKRLLIPYLVLNLLAVFIYGIIEYLKGDLNSFHPVLMRIYSFLLGLGYAIGEFKPLLTATWFIIALFFIRLIVSICYKYIWVITCCGIFIVLFLVKNKIDILPPIDSALLALPFFVIGFKSKKLIYKIKKCHFLVALFVTLSVNWLNGRVDIDLTDFGNNILLFYVGGLSGTIMIFAFAKILDAFRTESIIRFITIYSNGTLLVVAYNIIAIYTICKIAKYFVGDVNSFVGFVLGVLIFLMFYPAILFCTKYCPIVIGLKK